MNHLRVVPDPPQEEHKPVCGQCGEEWPCAVQRKKDEYESFQLAQWHQIRCRCCHDYRNYWASLNIEKGLDGQPVYFHDRKRCREAAERWWNNNVKPLINEDFTKGQHIIELVRYVSCRTKPVVSR